MEYLNRFIFSIYIFICNFFITRALLHLNKLVDISHTPTVDLINLKNEINDEIHYRKAKITKLGKIIENNEIELKPISELDSETREKLDKDVHEQLKTKKLNEKIQNKKGRRNTHKHSNKTVLKEQEKHFKKHKQEEITTISNKKLLKNTNSDLDLICESVIHRSHKSKTKEQTEGDKKLHEMCFKSDDQQQQKTKFHRNHRN